MTVSQVKTIGKLHKLELSQPLVIQIKSEPLANLGPPFRSRVNRSLRP